MGLPPVVSAPSHRHGQLERMRTHTTQVAMSPYSTVEYVNTIEYV